MLCNLNRHRNKKSFHFTCRHCLGIYMQHFVIFFNLFHIRANSMHSKLRDTDADSNANVSKLYVRLTAIKKLKNRRKHSFCRCNHYNIRLLVYWFRLQKKREPMNEKETRNREINHLVTNK